MPRRGHPNKFVGMAVSLEMEARTYFLCSKSCDGLSHSFLATLVLYATRSLSILAAIGSVGISQASQAIAVKHLSSSLWSSEIASDQ